MYEHIQGQRGLPRGASRGAIYAVPVSFDHRLTESVEGSPYLSRAYSTRLPGGEAFRMIKVILTRHAENPTPKHQGEQTWKVPNSTGI